MAPKRSKPSSPDKSKGSTAPDVMPVIPEAMENDENDKGQKDAAARDDVDADAEMQMGDKTEMAYAITEPEAAGENAATIAKRTVKNMNAEGVRDFANMVTRASPLLTGGEHTGLAQYERVVSFGTGVTQLPSGTSIFRGGGIGGSDMFLRLPQGSALAPLMLDMQTQAGLRNVVLKAAGEAEAKLAVTVEADVRRFTVPRLDQGDWDRTIAVVFDTDMKASDIATMMNAAAAAAHVLDDTRPASYFEETAGEFRLSREIIARSIPSSMASKVDTMIASGKCWVLEDSAQVKIQTEEFYIQGFSSFRDVKVGGEGRTFILSTFGEVTEIYDIYIHDYDDLKNTGIYAVKLTIQAKCEEEFKCLVRRLAAKCENGPLRARYGKNVRGYVVTCTMHEAFEKAGLNPWDLAGKDAAQRQQGATQAGNEKMVEKATAAATEAAKTAASIAQREVDNKIKKSMEVATATQAKLDELARAQVDAAAQTKVDKEAHKALIDEGIKTAQAAHEAAEAAKRGASKAWNEAQAAKAQAAAEQLKVNAALAQLAMAQTAAEERHSMHQQSHTQLLTMLKNSAEVRMGATANVREIRDKLEGQAEQTKRTQRNEWCAFERQLRSWGVGRGHEAELHEMLVAVAAAMAGRAVVWTVPAPIRGGLEAEVEADGPIAAACAQIDAGTYANAQHETSGEVGEHGRAWRQGGWQLRFSSANARILADMRRPPRPPKPRDK